MARYQNGLFLRSTVANLGGYVFSRWLFEWLTQVVGWTDHDHNDSKWTDVEASGSGVNQGDTTADVARVDMSGSGRSWTTADRNKYITITGLTTAERDGVYRILDVEASDILLLDIKRGVHDAGLPNGESFDWRLWDGSSTYYAPNGDWAIARSAYSHTPAEPNFDVRMMPYSTEGGAPSLAIGPFGTWDNVGHAWTGSRNTAQKNPSRVYSADAIYVFAHATETHATIVWWTWNDSDALSRVHFIHLGEMDVPSTTDDPNPGVMGQGALAEVDFDRRKAIGNPYNNGVNGINEGFRWMSKLPADDTEVTAYAQTPCCLPDLSTGGANVIDDMIRRHSAWSRAIYRINIALECATVGHMETRGMLNDVWLGNRYIQFLMPFGSSKEYLHLFGGISIPWNGSSVHVQQ